jgi:hypothetical protein
MMKRKVVKTLLIILLLIQNKEIMSQNLYIINQGTLYNTAVQDGAWIQLGKTSDWSATTAFATNYDNLFAVANGLWKINFTNGSYSKLGTGIWKNSPFMTFCNANLYIITDGTIWKTNPTNGTWTQIGKTGDWKAATALSTDGYNLYIICNGLYKVNAETGAYAKLGTGIWKDCHEMTYSYGSLYMIQDGTIWRTNTDNGSWIQIGNPGDWKASTAMTGDYSYLYIACNGLYRVNPETGEYLRIGKDAWKDVRFMLVK